MGMKVRLTPLTSPRPHLGERMKVRGISNQYRMSRRLAHGHEKPRWCVTPRSVIASDRRERGTLTIVLVRDCFVALLLAMTRVRGTFEAITPYFMRLYLFAQLGSEDYWGARLPFERLCTLRGLRVAGGQGFEPRSADAEFAGEPPDEDWRSWVGKTVQDGTGRVEKRNPCATRFKTCFPTT